MLASPPWVDPARFSSITYKARQLLNRPGISSALLGIGKNAASSTVTNKESFQEFNGVTSLDLDYLRIFRNSKRAMFL